MSRLEEIKRVYNYPNNNKNGYPYWLISRVDELEEENKRYKEDLEFYANEKTYNLGVQFSIGSAHPRHEPIKYDKWRKST